MRDAETTIGNLADKQTVAFIGAADEEGFPVVKAMLAPRKREGIKVFYFTTNTSSRHTAQYREAMLKGTMEILEDSESKEMIWREGDTMYYPGGVTDPDYCVMRFTAVSGRFYSNFHSEDFEV